MEEGTVKVRGGGERRIERQSEVGGNVDMGRKRRVGSDSARKCCADLEGEDRTPDMSR